MRELIAEMRELLVEKAGAKEHAVVFNAKEPYPYAVGYSFDMGNANASHVVADGPPGKVTKKIATKLAKEHGIKNVLTDAQWKKLIAFDHYMGGKRVIPIKDIDWKKMPTEAGCKKLSVPRITTYKWTPSAAKEAKTQGITPTFGLRSPYKKDYIAAFSAKIPKEARYWDKFNQEWVVDKSYEPLVIMLIHEFFMVDPEEFDEPVSNPMEKALWADRKKKVGGKPAGELSITADPSGWYTVVTPWNPGYLKTLKASFQKKNLKWDKLQKAWKVKTGKDGLEVLKDIIQIHYKKAPTVIEDRGTMGNLIDELRRCVA